MLYDIVPIQAIVLVPTNPIPNTMKSAVDVPDELYAEWCSSRDAFQKCQGALAKLVKDAEDAKKPSALLL